MSADIRSGLIVSSARPWARSRERSLDTALRNPPAGGAVPGRLGDLGDGDGAGRVVRQMIQDHARCFVELLGPPLDESEPGCWQRFPAAQRGPAGVGDPDVAAAVDETATAQRRERVAESAALVASPGQQGDLVDRPLSVLGQDGQDLPLGQFEPTVASALGTASWEHRRRKGGGWLRLWGRVTCPGHCGLR